MTVTIGADHIDWAAWFTAGGTLALAFVTYYATKSSLKIAARDNIVSVTIDAALFRPMNTSLEALAATKDYYNNLAVTITLTNECKKAVRVAQVYWTFDEKMVLHRWYAVSSTGLISTHASSIVDIKLAPFDNHAERSRLGQVFALIDKELCDLKGVVSSIKINVMLSDGKVFSSSLDDDFDNLLKEHVAYLHRVNQQLQS